MSATITGSQNGTVGLINIGTAVTASGTAVTFTGIPSGVKRVTFILSSVQGSGSSPFVIRLGSGSIQSSGYTGSTYTASANYTALTSGVQVQTGVSSAQGTHSIATIVNVSGNLWNIGGDAAVASGGSFIAGNYSYAVTLAGTLDRVQLTTVNGTDTFSAGTVNILYE